MRLLPGKLWGTAGHALKLTGYGGTSLGLEGVAVANLLGSFNGYIHPSTTAVALASPLLTLSGTSLKPANALNTDVSLAVESNVAGCVVTATIKTPAPTAAPTAPPATAAMQPSAASSYTLKHNGKTCNDINDWKVNEFDENNIATTTAAGCAAACQAHGPECVEIVFSSLTANPTNRRGDCYLMKAGCGYHSNGRFQVYTVTPSAPPPAATASAYTATSVVFDLVGLASCGAGASLLAVMKVAGAVTGPSVAVAVVTPDYRGAGRVDKSTANLVNSGVSLVVLGDFLRQPGFGDFR